MPALCSAPLLIFLWIAWKLPIEKVELLAFSLNRERVVRVKKYAEQSQGMDKRE